MDTEQRLLQRRDAADIAADAAPPDRQEEAQAVAEALTLDLSLYRDAVSIRDTARGMEDDLGKSPSAAQYEDSPHRHTNQAVWRVCNAAEALVAHLDELFKEEAQ